MILKTHSNGFSSHKNKNQNPYNALIRLSPWLILSWLPWLESSSPKYPLLQNFLFYLASPITNHLTFFYMCLFHALTTRISMKARTLPCPLLYPQQRVACSRYVPAMWRLHAWHAAALNMCSKVICLDSGLGENSCCMRYMAHSFLNYVQFIIRNMKTLHYINYSPLWRIWNI